MTNSLQPKKQTPPNVKTNLPNTKSNPNSIITSGLRNNINKNKGNAPMQTIQIKAGEITLKTDPVGKKMLQISIPLDFVCDKKNEPSDEAAQIKKPEIESENDTFKENLPQTIGGKGMDGGHNKKESNDNDNNAAAGEAKPHKIGYEEISYEDTSHETTVHYEIYDGDTKGHNKNSTNFDHQAKRYGEEEVGEYSYDDSTSEEKKGEQDEEIHSLRDKTDQTESETAPTFYWRWKWTATFSRIHETKPNFTKSCFSSNTRRKE